MLTKAKNKNIFNENKKYKIATCGLHTNILKFYLNKDFDIEYNFVNNNDEYDFIIFINRVYIKKDNLSNPKTCYNKFFKEDIVKVIRNSLPMSFISN